MSIVRFYRWGIIALAVVSCLSQAMENASLKRKAEETSDASSKKQCVEQKVVVIANEGTEVAINFNAARLSPTLAHDIDDALKGDDWTGRLTENIDAVTLTTGGDILHVLGTQGVALDDIQNPDKKAILRYYPSFIKLLNTLPNLEQAASYFDLPLMQHMIQYHQQRSNRYLLYMLRQPAQRNIWNNIILMLQDDRQLNGLKKATLQSVGASIGYQELLTGQGIVCFSWSADGKLATGLGDAIVRIWQVTAHGYECIATLTGHADAIQSVSWSADGRLATGSADNTVKIWQATNNGYECIATLTGHTNNIRSVSWSADGKLATGSWDKTVKIWQATANGYECIATLTEHTNIITSVSWSANGILATGSFDNTVRIWQATNNGYECIAILTGHTSNIRSVSWSMDSKLATGSWDKTARIWQASANGYECIAILTETDFIHSVSWSVDGKLATGLYDNMARIWQATAHGYECIAILTGHTSNVTSVSWSMDGKYLATGSLDKTVRIWDMALLINVDNYLSTKLFSDEIMLLKKIDEARKSNGTYTYQLNEQEQKVYEGLGGGDDAIKDAIHKVLNPHITYQIAQ